MNCAPLFNKGRAKPLKPTGEPKEKPRGLGILVCIPYSPNVTNPMKQLEATVSRGCAVELNAAQ